MVEFASDKTRKNNTDFQSPFHMVISSFDNILQKSLVGSSMTSNNNLKLDSLNFKKGSHAMTREDRARSR